MSAYRIAIAAAVLVIIIFLWIPLNDVTQDIGSRFNDMVNESERPDVIEKNNMALSIFYWSLLIIIFAVGILLLKNSLEGRTEYYEYG